MSLTDLHGHPLDMSRIISAPADIELIRRLSEPEYIGETLAACFARLHAEVGSLSCHSAAEFDGYRYSARQRLAQDDSMTLGEVYALWCHVERDAAEDAHTARLTELLAQHYADEISTEDFCVETDRNDRRRARRLNAATKRAYNMTSTEFVRLWD